MNRKQMRFEAALKLFTYWQPDDTDRIVKGCVRAADALLAELNRTVPVAPSIESLAVAACEAWCRYAEPLSPYATGQELARMSENFSSCMRAYAAAKAKQP